MKKVISNRFLAFALSVMLIFCLTPIYGLASDDPVESGEIVENTVDTENENTESGKVTTPAENNVPADTPADNAAPENNNASIKAMVKRPGRSLPRARMSFLKRAAETTITMTILRMNRGISLRSKKSLLNSTATEAVLSHRSRQSRVILLQYPKVR